MIRKVEDSTVVITGGTGSFGSTMAKHLLSKSVGELRIFSRDEAKQDAMRHTLADPRVLSRRYPRPGVGREGRARLRSDFPCSRVEAGAVSRVFPSRGCKNQH